MLIKGGVVCVYCKSVVGDYHVQMTPVQSSFISLFFAFFLHLLHNKNKLREYWLPRITDNLVMIGSQFIHMFTTTVVQVGTHYKQIHNNTKRIRVKGCCVAFSFGTVGQNPSVLPFIYCSYSYAIHIQMLSSNLTWYCLLHIPRQTLL